MQNLAYKLDVDQHETHADELRTTPARRASADSDHCAACGEELFDPDAQAASWQAWETFWEIIGMNNVEIVCGACREYLKGFFDKK